MESRILGRGVFGWERYERMFDRYGAVGLWSDDTDLKLKLKTRGLEGKRGRLVARVVEERESRHIGDLSRGKSAGGAAEGREVVLGEGELFTDASYNDRHNKAASVGLRPEEDREAGWLDVDALYSCVSQVVELRFEYDQGPVLDEESEEGRAIFASHLQGLIDSGLIIVFVEGEATVYEGSELEVCPNGTALQITVKSSS